jgi:hypothetical protein
VTTEGVANILCLQYIWGVVAGEERWGVCVEVVGEGEYRDLVIVDENGEGE